MAALASTLKVKGLSHKALLQLARKAKRLGVTPELYVCQLVQEDLALDEKARTTTLSEIMGRGRIVDESELDDLVEAARVRHHRGTAKRV